MIKPIKRNVEVYKGATFKLQFRIKHCGSYLDLTGYGIFFTASDKVAGTPVFEESNSSSPSRITVDADDNWLVTIELTPEQTAGIEQKGSLYFEIDTVNSDDERERRWIGEMILMEQADGSD